MKHQAFSALGGDLFEFGLQGFFAREFELLNPLELRPIGFLHQGFELVAALGERAAACGQLKHHVLDLLPFCIDRLQLAHDA